MSLILKSGSFEPKGEKGREHNLERVIENAGYELPEKEPKLDARGPNITDQAMITDYGAQVEAAKRKYPDWDEVVGQEIHIGREVQLALLENEHAAELVYHLGKNKTLAERLGKMRPLAAVQELGRLAGNVDKPVRHAKPVNVENLSFAEISEMAPWPGKARALRRAERRR